LRNGAPGGPSLDRRGILAALGALAQAWPAQPIRPIVPFPPGGGTDVISRQLAERIGAHTGWTIVIAVRDAGIRVE
jgi:tripartite-type tricarboxylate transporter receptor subunit TctC